MGTVSRRQFLNVMGSASLGFAAASCPGLPKTGLAVAQNRRKLNFVLFLIDDMGWVDTGCYGSTFYETPNIDRLASQGVRFTNAYAACPVCSPTRASILTGKYPARLHLTDWIPGHKFPKAKLKPPAFNQELPFEEITIAEALKEAGYTSASIGKWHLGAAPFLPERQGFDLNFGGDNHGHPGTYFYPYKGPEVPTGQPGEYLTDRLTDEALRFIEQSKDKPFFLYFPHYAVHAPIEGKREYIGHYEAKVKSGQAQNNAAYAAMIQSVDESVGRVLAKLDELGIADNTVVFFMSDNGGLIPVTSNAPLRAGKGTLYEGGIREPWLVRWPGVTAPGSTCDSPVISVDFLPTILAMAGITPYVASLDGLDLTPVLRRQGAPHRDTLYWHYPHYHPGGTTPAGAIRQSNYKLIEYYGEDRIELYDLKADLGEAADMAARMPDKTRQMQKNLHDWLQSVDAQMPTPNPDYDPTKKIGAGEGSSGQHLATEEA